MQSWVQWEQRIRYGKIRDEGFRIKLKHLYRRLFKRLKWFSWCVGGGSRMVKKETDQLNRSENWNCCWIRWGKSIEIKSDHRWSERWYDAVLIRIWCSNYSKSESIILIMLSILFVSILSYQSSLSLSNVSYLSNLSYLLIIGTDTVLYSTTPMGGVVQIPMKRACRAQHY